jgi:APA family basic amino acid/polyamine antiporter
VNGLRQDVGLLGVVTLGAGAAIGVSVLTVLQPAAQIAGAGLLVALLIAALPMLLFALTYAYLSSVAPASGASYEWPRRYLHPFIGFAIAWARIVANVAALVILAQVFAQYLNMLLPAPMPVKLVMAAAISLVFTLNAIGIAVAARVQSMLMLMLLIVLALFVATGAPHVSIARIGAPLSAGAASIAACAVLMTSLFAGVESAAEIGEEVRDSRRTIPLGIALAVALTTLVYTSVAATELGLLGPDALARSPVPLLDAARVPFGDLAVPVISVTALVSILKSMNATALVFSRSLFAMARGATLPDALTRIHPRFGTPHLAILAAWLCAMAGLLLPDSLIFLLLAVNVPTTLKYGACACCAVRAASRPAPEDARPLLPARAAKAVGWLGMAAAAALIVAGMEGDWRPHLLVALWLLMGFAYWAWLRAGKAGR